MTGTTGERAVKTSAWFLYTLIVLEILFMVSPFAAYYYSIYATPLNLLQQSPQTAWLTMYLLPHFTYTDSWLANGLVLISWPLILIGVLIFVVGFCQIYWAKFTDRGAVAAGLYRHIRHPQYVALAITGLGTSLYWSRFIVIIAFVSMLYIYVFLARVEERICLEKFGRSYRDYMNRTGMFLPRRWEQRWSGMRLRLPKARWTRATMLLGLYGLLLTVTVGAGYLLRSHVLDSLQTDASPERVAVFLAPVSATTRGAVAAMLRQSGRPGTIAYVAPSAWRIPELGFEGDGSSREHGGLSEILHPTTHGNPLVFDEDRLTVLEADALLARIDAQGIDRLAQALDIRPQELIEFDVASGEVISRRPAGEGQWAGVPVPTF